MKYELCYIVCNKYKMALLLTCIGFGGGVLVLRIELVHFVDSFDSQYQNTTPRPIQVTSRAIWYMYGTTRIFHP